MELAALEFETELLVGAVGTEEIHFVLRADETFENYEKSYLRIMIHIFLAFAPDSNRDVMGFRLGGSRRGRCLW